LRSSSANDSANKLVSVIMPLFNHEKYIGAAIDSVLAQTYKHWELIIIDDGSTDGSANVVKNYLKKDNRISYHHQKNQGEYGARNAGLRLARGQYIAWLDADDVAHRDKLAKQLDYLEKNQDTAVCGTQCNRVDANGRLIEKQVMGKFFVPYRRPNGTPRNPLTDAGNDIIGATIMVRKKCYDVVGHYRAVDVGTDYDMLLRCEERFKMVNLPDYLYDWRLHGDASIARVKKTGYHGRLGISLNRLVVNLSCLARRFYGYDPLGTLPPAQPLARPRVFFLFWRTPRVWRYIPQILRINKMSVPEFLVRLVVAGLTIPRRERIIKSLKK
ncbi:MAG: glycosyltransferase family 2 protein, partial [Hydrotalea sp.]|nr:glycosyltransferase family 2 protein [Hydrotalea sp.]